MGRHGVSSARSAKSRACSKIYFPTNALNVIINLPKLVIQLLSNAIVEYINTAKVLERDVQR